MINNYILSKIVEEIGNKYISEEIYICKRISKFEYFILFKSRKLSPLYISIHPEYYSLNISQEKPEVKSKHPQPEVINEWIKGKTIDSVSQPDFDRVVEIILSDNHKLILELFPPQPTITLIMDKNIIFTTSRKIIDVYKHPPVPDSNSLYKTSEDNIKGSLLDNTEDDLSFYQLIRNTFIEIDTLWAKLICKLAGINPYIKNNCIESIDNIVRELIILKKHLHTKDKKYLVITDKSENPQIFLYEPDGFSTIYSSPSPSIAQNKYIEVFIKNKEYETLKTKSEEILKKLMDTTKKKIKILNDELSRASNYEQYKKMGDLIMLHLNEIKRGQSEVSLKDFESGDIIEIELDKGLTPHENASEYYNKSKRLERGINKIKKELKQTKDELSSLPETTPDNIKELKEFIDRHSPETETRRSDKSIKSQDGKDYYRFKISDDYVLLVGKNAKGNSYITFRLGKGDDLWFHTRDYRGAHGVLKKTGKKEFRKEDITLSASIVAFFSKAKRDSKVEVSYTRVKYVKKTKTEGRVLITNEKSLLIKPKSPKELDL